MESIKRIVDVQKQRNLIFILFNMDRIVEMGGEDPTAKTLEVV